MIWGFECSRTFDDCLIPQVVSRSSDLVRASACVAALTDAVEALKMVSPKP